MGDHLLAYTPEERLLILQGKNSSAALPVAWDRDGASVPNVTGIRESLAVSSQSRKGVAGHFSVRRATEEATGPVLLCSGVLMFLGCYVAFTLVPLFETLRSAVGFSSMQVPGLTNPLIDDARLPVGPTAICAEPLHPLENMPCDASSTGLQVAFLNASPLLFMGVLTVPVASLVRNSRAWDLIVWTAVVFATGAWVSACAALGSPLEYLLLGQLVTGSGLAVVSWLPGKLSTCWLAPERVPRAHALWASAIALGLGLPYLVSPFMSGGDGLGRHLGSFLLYRAITVTVAAALVLLVRVRVERMGDDEETVFLQQEKTFEVADAMGELSANRELRLLCLAIAPVLSAAFSLYLLVPSILAHPPTSLTPAQVGVVAWGIFPGGLLGVVCAERLWSPGRTQRFRAPLLVCAAGVFFWLVVLLFLIGRSGKGALSFALMCVAAFASAFAHVGRHALLARAFPVSELLAVPILSAGMAMAAAIGPLATAMMLRGSPMVYETEATSPSGLLFAPAAIFWLLLVGGGAALLGTAIKDDERRGVVDQFPHLIAHVTDRIAADLSEAREFAEAVIPLPRS
jgi:hypothetical protein